MRVSESSWFRIPSHRHDVTKLRVTPGQEIPKNGGPVVDLAPESNADLAVGWDAVYWTEFFGHAVVKVIK